MRRGAWILLAFAAIPLRADTLSMPINLTVGTNQTLLDKFRFDPAAVQQVINLLADIGRTPDDVTRFEIIVSWTSSAFQGAESSLFDSTGVLLGTQSVSFSGAGPTLGADFVFNSIGKIFKNQNGALSFKNIGPPLFVTGAEFVAEGNWGSGYVLTGTTGAATVVTPEPSGFWMLTVLTISFAVRRFKLHQMARAFRS
jgi:hypothetical protein